MRGMLMADFNRPADALASFEKAVALKPDYSKARWGACTAALPILYAEEGEIAAHRADYERRLRALCADYEAGRIPGDMSKGLGMAPAVLPRLPGPQRPRPAEPVRRPCRAHHGRALRRGRARAAARAGRAGARRHRQRLLLPAFGLEDRRQGLGHPARSASASRCSAITPARSRTAKPQLARKHCHRFVQGPHSTERWRRDHPGRPAARSALSRTSA